MAPYFITFEGPEGSGKTTQARLLLDAFNQANHPAILTREPGGDSVSERIRSILLNGDDDSITDEAELLLYLAARAQHTRKTIEPKLAAGYSVICGRYIDSTVAYQGYGSGFDLELIYKMNEFATGGLTPNITFLLDIDVEDGLKRQRDWNRIERKTLEYHNRVRNGFLQEAKCHPNRIAVIDASADIESVRRNILLTLANRLALHISTK